MHPQFISVSIFNIRLWRIFIFYFEEFIFDWYQHVKYISRVHDRERERGGGASRIETFDVYPMLQYGWSIIA